MVRAYDAPVHAARLANGLSILAQPDHSLPIVSLYLFYRAGSRNERPGLTGLSHFIEHMMFNGSRRFGPKQFDRIMESAGGRNNAYTNQNMTVYQDWFPTEALETVLELEADRMAALLIDPATVESERAVVAAERRAMTESDHHALLEELLWSTAYTSHPYRWPVIGWMEDIAAWRVEDLTAYHAAYYAPENALLVAVGDVEPDRLVALVDRAFGAIDAGTPPPPVGVTEPPQRGERRAELSRAAQLASLAVGWRIPPTKHPDYYPLRLLETLLLSGQSSRLYSRLVDDERVALGVGGGFDVAFDPTLFLIACDVREGETAARAEALLFEEIERLAVKGPAEGELVKAKRIRLADTYRGLKTMSGRANDLGVCEIFFGDHAELFRAEQAFESVEASDVRRVAERHLAAENRTVTTLVPKDGDGGEAS